MPAPQRPNTAPATAARLAKARERRLTAMAEELRAAGYKVTAPMPPPILCPDCDLPWEHPGPHMREVEVEES